MTWPTEDGRQETGGAMSAMAPDTIGDLGSILGVWAHPDDEAWLSAGLMARAVDAGRRVVCVTATAGEAGFPDGDPRPKEERMAIRRAEMAASLGEVGVTEHHWLGYRDGHCDEIADEEAIANIARPRSNRSPAGVRHQNGGAEPRVLPPNRALPSDDGRRHVSGSDTYKRT